MKTYKGATVIEYSLEERIKNNPMLADYYTMMDELQKIIQGDLK